MNVEFVDDRRLLRKERAELGGRLLLLAVPVPAELEAIRENQFDEALAITFELLVALYLV